MSASPDTDTPLQTGHQSAEAVAPTGRGPSAVPHAAGSIAERYARMAHEGFEPRRVDLALRALDLGIAGVCLVLLLPAVLPIALAIVATSGGPVLYRGARVGRAGRTFTMLKFRTLKPDAEARLGPYLGEELTLRTEAESTAIGRVLRASRLDEVPQLWNVLKGEMTIVGPRPVRPAFFEELCEQIPKYWQRLVVRPGLTGFAQLRMTREMSWADKLAHDLEYIADRSVHLYLLVVGGTVWHILTRLFTEPWRAMRGRS